VQYKPSHVFNFDEHPERVKNDVPNSVHRTDFEHVSAFSVSYFLWFCSCCVILRSNVIAIPVRPTRFTPGTHEFRSQESCGATRLRLCFRYRDKNEDPLANKCLENWNPSKLSKRSSLIKTSHVDKIWCTEYAVFLLTVLRVALSTRPYCNRCHFVTQWKNHRADRATPTIDLQASNFDLGDRQLVTKFYEKSSSSYAPWDRDPPHPIKPLDMVASHLPFVETGLRSRQRTTVYGLVKRCKEIK